MIVNPFDEKIRIAVGAFEYWVHQGDTRMADRMFDMWERLLEKGADWENAMMQTRIEILDAVAAYEKRVGLR